MFSDHSEEEEASVSQPSFSGNEEDEEGEHSAFGVEEVGGTFFSVMDSLDGHYLQQLRTFNTTPGDEPPDAKLQFILVDIDIITDRRHGTLAVMFGRAHPSNQSVMVNLFGWYPSMCVEEPRGYNDQLHRELLKEILSQLIRKRIHEGYPEYAVRTLNTLDCDLVVDIAQVSGTDIMGYSPSDARDKSFLRIQLASPLFVSPLRESLEGDYMIDPERPWEKGHGLSLLIGEGQKLQVSAGKSTKTFNSNFEPVLQFMVDVGIAGCQWCQVPAPRDYGSKKSNCDVEIAECSIACLELVDLMDKSDVGSIRILSFDLEAAGRKGVFPDPAIDPVIQIGIQLQVQGHASLLRSILLSFKACSDIEGADVFSFESEASMLTAFRCCTSSFNLVLFSCSI